MYKVYMNQHDYDRIIKTMRLHGAHEELVAAVAGTLQAGRISTKASRTYEWDRLLRGTVAQVASIQSNLRSHTGTVRLIRERLLKQARAARDAIGNASITGKAIEDFTRYEPAPAASMSLPRRRTTADWSISRSASSSGSGWVGSYGTSEFT